MNLVIGGTGFLGAEIVKQLVLRGERVRAFSRRPFNPAEIFPGCQLDSAKSDVVSGDMANLEALQKACDGVETVYHTASWPSMSVLWQPFYQINVLGAENVVKACLAAGVKKLVYTSSAGVIFDCVPQHGVDESVPYPKKWLAHYAHSKAIAEKMILELGQKKQLLTCAIRPHLMIGQRDHHLFPRLFDRARRGRLFRVGDGSNFVDIIFVENAALAHIQAADALTSFNSVVNGKSYFISQGEPVNCWQWIDEVLQRKGLPKVKKAISFKTAWRLGAFLEGVYKLGRFPSEPLMTRFLAAQLGQTHYLNIAAARRDFGFTPKVGMEEGMAFLEQ